MKFTRSDIFSIAKASYELGGDKSKRSVEYPKWVEFIDKHPEDFIWYEKTKSGIETAKNIALVPEHFKDRIMASLNKNSCYKEFDDKKGFYNINIGFNHIDEIVSISFERTPKLEDLKLFLNMANHLGALLLKDGSQVIDEKIIESLS